MVSREHRQVRRTGYRPRRRSVLLAEAGREARRRGVRLAVSSPCFELWLLLHHTDRRAKAEEQAYPNPSSGVWQLMETLLSASEGR